MTKISRFGILSVAKISALIYAIFGLIAGLITALFSMLASAVGGDFEPWFFGFGFLSIIIFPIMYGILGFIGGIISSALYNLLSRWVGGIEVELEQ